MNCSSESELMISSEDSRSSLSYGGLVRNSDLLIVKSSYYDGSILVNYDDSGSSGAFGGACRSVPDEKRGLLQAADR